MIKACFIKKECPDYQQLLIIKYVLLSLAKPLTAEYTIEAIFYI